MFDPNNQAAQAADEAKDNAGAEAATTQEAAGQEGEEKGEAVEA